MCWKDVFLTLILKTEKQNVNFKNKKRKTVLKCFGFFVILFY